MAIIHPPAIDNARVQVVADATDAGSTSSSAAVEIRAADETVVASCFMTNPAWGDPAAGAMTANPIEDDLDAVGGTADHFVVVDLDGNPVMQGTITAPGGGGDMELSSLEISAGDTVAITQFLYSASTI